MRGIFSILAMLLVLVSTRAQVEEQPLDSVSEKLIIIAGDSIMRGSIALEEAYIFGRLKFNSYDDKLRYYILRRKTHKVYPYAKLAAERLVSLNDSLKYIKKKDIVKDIQKRCRSI